MGFVSVRTFVRLFGFWDSERQGQWHENQKICLAGPLKKKTFLLAHNFLSGHTDLLQCWFSPVLQYSAGWDTSNRQIWDWCWSSHLTLGKKWNKHVSQNVKILLTSLDFLSCLFKDKKQTKPYILLYIKSKMKRVCVVEPEGKRVVPGCLLHVSKKTNSSGCPQINVITEAIDLVLIGWERHFTRWLGLHEVVIKDVLREQLSWGLAGYVPAASLSRRWQHSKLTNVCLEYHNGSCWYWGWTNPVLLAYKWTVWLIQVEEKAHDSASPGPR